MYVVFALWKFFRLPLLLKVSIRSQINDEASDKVLEVEQKYTEVRRPVHKERNEVIKRIPEFWATTFANHPSLGEHLSEEDKHIFTFLTEV